MAESLKTVLDRAVQSACMKATASIMAEVGKVTDALETKWASAVDNRSREHAPAEAVNGSHWEVLKGYSGPTSPAPMGCTVEEMLARHEDGDRYPSRVVCAGVLSVVHAIFPWTDKPGGPTQAEARERAEQFAELMNLHEDAKRLGKRLEMHLMPEDQQKPLQAGEAAEHLRPVYDLLHAVCDRGWNAVTEEQTEQARERVRDVLRNGLQFETLEVWRAAMWTAANYITDPKTVGSAAGSVRSLLNTLASELREQPCTYAGRMGSPVNTAGNITVGAKPR